MPREIANPDTHPPQTQLGRLLICDDSTDERTALGAILRQQGYEVKERPILLDEAAVAREVELDG